MSSIASTISFQDALRNAYEGKWQLPEFQRDVKWKRKQNMLLFDSLRNNFPIGTFLTAQKGTIENIKPLKFTDTSKKNDLELLVLDGQQRITAGIQLFFANKNFHNERQKTFYYIDLNKLQQIIDEYSEVEGHFNPNDDLNIEEFGNYLDADSGYIVPRSGLKDLFNPFISKGLVSTALLHADNEDSFYTYKSEYLTKHPDREILMNVFIKLFRKNKKYDTQVPNITVKTTDTKILTRIFSTLNNTGISLTPFEITISEMYGQGVDLNRDIQTATSNSLYYQNFDTDKNLVLQACILLSGQDKGHKKTDLPKSLNKDIWENNKDKAFKSIELTAKFLTQELGVGLDSTSDFVPYETALLPLVYLFSKYNPYEIEEKKKHLLSEIAKYYFVSTALKLRFTEGASSKQIIDKKALVSAYEKNDKRIIDEAMGEKKFTGLKEVTKSGAKGRIMLCIQSANDLLDPLTDSRISLSDKPEVHHIFPQSYIKNDFNIPLKDLRYSPNHISNLMIVQKSTNIEFGDKNPAEQIEKVSRQREDYEVVFGRHLISKKSLEILKRKKKSHKDYYEFIEQRSLDIIIHIKDRYKIEAVSDDEGSMDSDEDAE